MPDVQAALTVLGRRQTAPDDPWLDLQALDLRGADLSRANFSRANFSDAVLVGAVLVRADLRDTFFFRADLRGADLRGATAGVFTSWPEGFDWQSAGVRQETSSTSP